MTEKKTVGLGKKASAEVAKKPEVPKLTPKKDESKATKAVAPKKPAPAPIKVESKEVPPIAAYQEKPKPEKVLPKDSKTTAKLPAKASGVADKMAKLRTSLKKVVTEHEEAPESFKEPEVIPSTISSTQLDLASTRRPVAAVKKGTVASGKIGFDEIFSKAAEPAPVTPAFFDAAKFLKK